MKAFHDALARFGGPECSLRRRALSSRREVPDRTSDTPVAPPNPNKAVALRVPFQARFDDAETASRSDLVKDQTVRDPRCLPSRRARNLEFPTFARLAASPPRSCSRRPFARPPSHTESCLRTDTAAELARPPSASIFALASSFERFSGPRTPPRDFCTHSRPRGHNLLTNGSLRLRNDGNASNRTFRTHF
jgi:hypothetical protein